MKYNQTQSLPMSNSNTQIFFAQTIVLTVTGLMYKRFFLKSMTVKIKTKYIHVQ